MKSTLGRMKKPSRTISHHKTTPTASKPSANKQTHSSKQLKQQYETLKTTEIHFIATPDFNHKKAYAEIVETPLPDRETQARARKRPKDVPAYLGALYEVPLLSPQQEVYLFRKMNYLKWFAAKKREQLVGARLTHKKLQEIEQALALACEARDQIIQANLRLVVSIARRFVDANNNFDDLVGEGNLALMNAADKFDYFRGFRFSTYATHAIQRNYYRTTARRQKYHQRMLLSAESESFADLGSDLQEERAMQETYDLYKDLISQVDELLNDRERNILVARFGLDGTTDPQTLKGVADELGICKERVRQLQNRAIGKLKDKARELHPEIMTI